METISLKQILVFTNYATVNVQKSLVFIIRIFHIPFHKKNIEKRLERQIKKKLFLFLKYHCGVISNILKIQSPSFIEASYYVSSFFFLCIYLSIYLPISLCIYISIWISISISLDTSVSLCVPVWVYIHRTTMSYGYFKYVE